MRCPRQSPIEEVQQAQFLPPLGGTEMVWPPCPPVPQPAFNPWVVSQYPMMSPTPLQSQLLPQIPGLGTRPLWFQGLVAAVSQEIKDNEKKAAAVDNACRKNAAPADLSAEDEKALVDALSGQREGRLTMEQVFGELSKNCSHTETEWKTLFFANYERLLSRPDLQSNLERASIDDLGSPRRSSSPVMSSTRSASRNCQSRASTRTSSALTESREESESHLESEIETESEWEDLCIDGRPARHELESSGPSTPHTQTQRKAHTMPARAPSAATSAGSEPARTARGFPVTDADLRAMAQYRFEKGDAGEVREYGYHAWREFALRPENSKRTLAAWTCVPRSERHSAADPTASWTAIDRYVREFQLRVEVAKSQSVLPVLSPPQSPAMPPSSGPGVAMGVAQKEVTVKQENGSGDLGNAILAGRAVNVMEIIDLTDDKEE